MQGGISVKRASDTSQEPSRKVASGLNAGRSGYPAILITITSIVAVSMSPV